VDCPAHEIHEIKCSTNKNDLTVMSTPATLTTNLQLIVYSSPICPVFNCHEIFSGMKRINLFMNHLPFT